MDNQEVQRNTQTDNTTVKKTENIASVSKEAFRDSYKMVLRYAITGGMILVVLVIGCIGSSYAFKFAMNRAKQNIEESLPFNNADEKAADDKKFDKPEKKSEAVIIGQVEWKLLEARSTRDTLKPDSEDSEYCKPGDDAKYVIITYTVRNVDRAFVTVPKDRVDIYDADESKYSPSSKVYKCVLNSTSLEEKLVPDILNRDEKREYTELFEVPKNSKNFRMKVGDLSIINKEFDYIALGF